MRLFRASSDFASPVSWNFVKTDHVNFWLFYIDSVSIFIGCLIIHETKISTKNFRHG